MALQGLPMSLETEARMQCEHTKAQGRKAPVQLQKTVNFSFSMDTVLVTYHIFETIEVFFSVFTLEPAIFKVTVPAKGGNCVSEVLELNRGKKKAQRK